MPKLQNLQNLSITTKFILYFLFIALLPLVIATYVSYNNSRKALEEEVTNSLLAVADNKANQIEVYLREKKTNLTRLSNSPDIIEILDRFNQAFDKCGISCPEYLALDDEFRPFLTYHQKLFGYDNFLFVNPEGEVIFSAAEIKELRSIYELALYEESELAKIFIKAKDSSETKISDFEYYPETKQAVLFIAASVFKEGDFIGVLIVQMSSHGLYDYVQDYTGLGQTGETFLASRKLDKVIFVTPLRFDPDAVIKRSIVIGSQEELDIQKAAQGKEGIGKSIDYRGKEVLAVYRYLPTFRLGMVVKMDTQEIFSSAERLRSNLLRISLVLLVIVVMVAIFIAHSVSSPIKELTNVSRVISGGNLAARAKINIQDEVGELARSFNQMTNSLVEAKATVEKERAKLEEQTRLLEKANQELDSFVYTVSHDLRAPLRGIASFANFLIEDYKDKLDEEGIDHLNEIRKGTERMSKLIDDLLKLSRISRIQNPYEEVDIKALINSVIQRIKFDIDQYRVDLRIQENMPVVSCDSIKMGEVFLNLINNAIKFSSKNNKENPRVEIGCKDAGEFHKFYVKDNGIGIAQQHHQQIFGIFKRLHTDKEYDGTGTGLSIVKRVIDDHAGDIWVESEPGKGATFYFTIPKGLKGKRKKIGEILIEDGFLTPQELDEGLKKQKTKKKIGQILIEDGSISNQELEKGLKEQEGEE
ncbi:MAG: ATP-binding protein [Candidatus Omnitrophota bacterium]|jgi:signal transduction histidine kinase